MKENEIKVSVRNLVEFVLRAGDIDSKFMSANRLLEGTKSHQKIQKAAGKAYIPEVYLSLSVEYRGFLITLEGRADGIITGDEDIVIDEIKTTTRPLEQIEENFNPLHWAQAKCYAYIYARQNNIPAAAVQLTYYQLDTEEKKCFRKTFGVKELEEFFYDLMDRYLIWADLTKTWNVKRDASVKKLKFPFASYRKGQRELAVSVYRTISGGKKLFVQAPTGTGKTISTLFPSVKAVGEGHISKIFYLTAKTITRQVAEEAFAGMRGQGLAFKTVTLTAKEKICLSKGAGCNPEQCAYAKGHFDRVNDAILDVLSRETNLTREVVERYAERYMVCPFEFSLDLSLWADCIICDYNYVFDPLVFLKRFFLNNQGNYVFLIDEAHNLVDRAREMFSAELCKSSFLELKKVMKAKDPKISRILSRVNTYMVDLRKQCGENGYLVQKEELKDLYRLLKSFIKVSEPWLAINQHAECFEELLALYFDATAFIKISEYYDDRYVTFIESGQGEVRVRLFCLDPSYLLGEAIKKGKAAVYFSATLAPLVYFREILGGDRDDYMMRLLSPFEQGHLCLLIADNVSTKYKNRENSYLGITELIASLVGQKPGNYIVYFPSYKYMREVVSRFAGQYPEINILVQESSMTEEERESFLARFHASGNLVGFCVLGGIFAEGVDLKGERLIGAVVVGVGLPQVSPGQDVIMNYFQAKNEMGYEYAYMFPGMNKVLQAAGRVIRSEHDRGVVLLVDERFAQKNYQKLFPQHWSHGVKVKQPNDIGLELKKFW